MNSIVLLLFGLGSMIVGFIFYSRFIANKVFKLDPNFITPAHQMQDGIDYVPTNKYVLWGHHFTSIAGVAPIIGPAIAVIWGWLPAFLWVVFGTIFMAGVHDMSAIWASVRNRGKSMGSVVGSVIGNRTRALLMIIIFLLLLMVNVVFGVVIARIMVDTPSAVIPVWGALIVALIVGQCIYRFKLSLPLVSLVGVIALYVLIWFGPKMPISLPQTMLGISNIGWWIIILFAYAAIASLLPVWMLLQPRDYINGLQLFIGLGILYISILIFSPDVIAPAINTNLPANTPPIIPLLFVTVACGAISGFHGLVASGTTSKQINKEPDIRFVGYFGAMGEGMLALGAIVAVTAGFATLADWQEIYTAFGKGSLGAFINGGSNIINNGIGLNKEISVTMLTVMAALFAGTTMDTSVRLQRYIIQEFGEIYNLPGLKNVSIATIVAIAICIALLFGTGGIDGADAIKKIWPLFGTTNQLIAGLTLIIVSVILLRKGIKSWYTLLPMIFLLIMTLITLVIKLQGFYDKEQWLLFSIDIVILTATILISFECVAVLYKEWPKKTS